LGAVCRHDNPRRATWSPIYSPPPGHLLAAMPSGSAACFVLQLLLLLTSHCDRNWQIVSAYNQFPQPVGLAQQPPLPPWLQQPNGVPLGTYSHVDDDYARSAGLPIWSQVANLRKMEQWTDSRIEPGYSPFKLHLTTFSYT